MFLFVLLFFYAIPTSNVSDPLFTLPSDMQSGFANVVIVPTTSHSSTITTGLTKIYSNPRPCVGLSTLELTPSSTIDFYIRYSSVASSTLTIAWKIENTIDLMKFSYLVWDYQSWKYPSQLLYFQGIRRNRYFFMGSTFPTYLKTGSQRSFTHSIYYFSTSKAIINIMINGIQAETLSNEYNVNATITQRKEDYIYLTISIGSDTKLERIDIQLLFWSSYYFIDTIYSYQDSITFVNDKTEGVLTDSDNSLFYTLIGWTGLSMKTSNSFKFDLASNPATDFFPNQLVNPVSYNSFNVVEFSKLTCSSDQLDTLTFKCKTIEEMYGCSNYGRAIKMPLDSFLEQMKVSPEGKYLVGCKLKKVYVLQYNILKAQYSLFQEIDLGGNCKRVETSRNWSYLATVVQQKIVIYGFNKTYQSLFQIKDGNYSSGFSFSANATFIYAKVYQNIYLYRLNYSAGTYQKFYSQQSMDSTQYGDQIREGEIIYIQKQSSNYNLIFRKSNQGYFPEDPGQPFFGMSITADETLQVTFNDQNFIVYNIDDEGQRTIHQTIPSKHFFSISRERLKIDLSDDGLTMVFMSVVNYNQRMIVVYERNNITADFVEVKHIHVLRDLDYEIQELQLSSDGEIIITSYKQNYLLFYYCRMTINETQILPEITYNISNPVKEQQSQSTVTEQPKNQTNTAEPQKQVDGLTVFLAVIGIANFGMLIVMAVLMIKKFTAPAQQPNHRIYNTNSLSQINNTVSGNNARVSDKSNILVDFSQQSIKSSEKPQNQNRTRKKRRTQQLSVGDIESQENIGETVS